ncbi:MAG TPA: TIGR03435 family protein [Bryobacteraceae bacterium]|nr:TIGR03435 family protein [Bryobacteraceae bacterium]
MRTSSPRTIGVAVLLAATAALAQTPAAPPLTFEVASVKPAGPLNPQAIMQGKVSVGMKVDGAICRIASFSLRDLIRTAYEVKDYQISGVDSLGNPLSAERFDIQATLPEGATEKQVPQMLQALLADRFKLVVHRESREQSVYALVVAKGGPKLQPAEADPAQETSKDTTPASSDPKKGETVLGQGDNQIRISGNMRDGKGIVVKGARMGAMHVAMVDGKMHLEAERMTMATLADTATSFVGKPVVDMTELKGEYKVTLDLSMDDLKNVARGAGFGAMMAGGAAASDPSPAQASDPTGSTIFVSIQQMGLKLEQRKAPLPFLVVDHFKKSPTEN